MKVKSESKVAQSCPTLATPWTAAFQAPLSMEFSRREYWSGVPLPSPSESYLVWQLASVVERGAIWWYRGEYLQTFRGDFPLRIPGKGWMEEEAGFSPTHQALAFWESLQFSGSWSGSFPHSALENARAAITGSALHAVVIGTPDCSMSTGRNSLHLRILPSGVILSFSFLECAHLSIQAWASRPLWHGEHPGGTWSERSSLGQTAWVAQVPLPCSFAFIPTLWISWAWWCSVPPCFVASPSCCPWSKPLALSQQNCTAKFSSVPSNKLIVEAPVAFRNMWTFLPPTPEVLPPSEVPLLCSSSSSFLIYYLLGCTGS